MLYKHLLRNHVKLCFKFNNKLIAFSRLTLGSTAGGLKKNIQNGVLPMQSQGFVVIQQDQVVPQSNPHQQENQYQQQQKPNQYYYYYGGGDGHLNDINPAQEMIQNEGIEETIQFCQYDSLLSSPQLIEEAILKEASTSPALLYNANNKTYSMPIRNIDINTELHIATAFVSMKITFKNTGNRKVNSLFILPCHGTVTSTKVNINNGARYLDTTFIDNKSAQQFESKQKKTQIDNESDQPINKYIPDLFRLPIADIAKDEVVTIQIDYMQSLQFVESRYHFYIPLNFGDGVLLNDNQLNNINIKCSINCLTPGIQYGSTTHYLSLTQNENLRCKLTTQPKQLTNNRDFHLFYSVETNAISAALLCNSYGRYKYDPSKSFTCFVNPPTKMEGIFRRDIVFLLDRSGSMIGKPFQDAVNGLIFALNTLTPYDRFSLIAFDHEQILFDPKVATNGFASYNVHTHCELYEAHPDILQKAFLFLNNISARGMTDIKTPLLCSMQYLNENNNNDNIPFIVLLTDGAVQDEKEIVQEITNIENNKIRILTFGIGQYCNEYFLKMLSLKTRGWNDGSIYPKDLYPKIRLMMDKAKTPILTDIELEIPNQINSDIYPRTIPDLFMNGPIVISGRYSGEMPQQVILKGKLQNGQILAIPIRCDVSQVIPIDKIFLKQRIDQLTAEYWLNDDDKIKQQIVDISINETFPSPFTSMVAYELTPKEKEQQDEDNANKKKKRRYGGLSGGQIAALAGGAVVIGAGVFLLGNVAATAGNLGIDGFGGGIGDIADVFGGVGSCGECLNCGGCLDALPCGDIDCGGCDGVINICESCGGVVGGCFESVGDLCGNIGECAPECIGGIGDLCGNLGQIMGEFCECFGQISGSVIAILGC